MNYFTRSFYAVAAIISALAGLAGSHTAFAANAIREVTTQLEGEQLFVRFDMEEPLTAVPPSFKTDQPARLVFDFTETTNKTGKTAIPVNTAGVKGLQLIQTDSKTRVLLNLHESRGFEASLQGNALVLKLSAFRQSIPANAPPTKAMEHITAPKSNLVQSASVRELTFRRGEEGQAVVLIDLTDGRVPLDIRRAGNSVVVDLQNTVIPDRLLSRRDVNDFATPASAITASTRGNQGRLEIQAKGNWIHQAQLLNDQLKIEIRALTAAETNRLVPVGQEGKKISVNFYDADLGMVLRTLAELSGRNVIVDPSLNGKKITITLEDMPFDHAIDLVLTQTNAGLRLKPDVVIFGAREVLLRRDQDMADEVARANETAPLIAETFQLDYISAQDMEGLIRVAQNENSTGNLEPSITATPEPGKGGQAKVEVSGKLRGLLSPRGIMSWHGSTNKLFIRDTQTVLDQIRQLIKEVDVPPKQVMVEARIVEVTTDFTKEIGARLRLGSQTISNKSGMGPQVALGTGSLARTNLFEGQSANITPTTNTVGAGYSIAKDLSANSLGIMLFNSAATRLLSLELNAAENDQKGKTISSPRVITQNRKSAKIENELSRSVPTSVNPTTGLVVYTIFKAPLSLEVTPSITPSNKLGLDLKVLKSKIIPGETVGEIVLERNTVETNVVVENGGTVVIGGFYREEALKTIDRIPVLGDLPYVGFFFKATQEKEQKTELLVFITPRIVNDALSLR